MARRVIKRITLKGSPGPWACAAKVVNRVLGLLPKPFPLALFLPLRSFLAWSSSSALISIRNRDSRHDIRLLQLWAHGAAPVKGEGRAVGNRFRGTGLTW